MDFTTINPATGQKIKSYTYETEAAVLQKLINAERSFVSWKASPVKSRVEYLRRLAMHLTEDRERLAATITMEMGKVKKEALAEVDKCATMTLYYAKHAEEFLADEEILADGKRHLVAREPLGVILSIMPWNFPFWQALRFAIPTILAGNTLILKHSNQVPTCALLLEELFIKAGLPAHLFQTIITNHTVVETLLKHQTVKGISFTGSTEVGKKVAALVGSSFKKVVLELGGSDPFIVFSSADLEKAAEHGAIGRLVNVGQSCIAAKRFIVHESIAERFAHLLAERMDKRIVGDPTLDETDLGPLVSMKAAKDLDGMVQEALMKGGKLFYKKNLTDLGGLYFSPTIITDVKPTMRVFKEETFGPVAPVITFKTEEEAIMLANSSPFGLGASVWSSDDEELLRVGKKIEAGVLFFNAFVKSDPRVPFGGVKESGIGRELGRYGLYEFTTIKAYNHY